MVSRDEAGEVVRKIQETKAVMEADSLVFFFFFLKTPEQKKEDGLNLKPWLSHCQIRTFNILLVLGPDGESQRMMTESVFLQNSSTIHSEPLVRSCLVKTCLQARLPFLSLSNTAAWQVKCL